MSEQDGDQSVSSRGRTATTIAAGVIWLAIFAIVVARLTASQFDFAVANIVTGLGTLLIWGLLTFCFFMAGSRAWIATLAAPLVLVALFSVFYRFERLDSELIPKFRWRWENQAELPSAGGEAETVDLGIFAPKDTDFPQFLGPNRDGVIADVNIRSDWETNPPKILWKQPIGEGWSGFVVQGDVAITMEQRDEEEWVSAYSVLDGSLIWHHAIPAFHTHVAGGTGPRSTPIIHDGRVYACSAVDKLVCLDLQSGEQIWMQDLLGLAGVSQEEFEVSVAWGRSGSPMILDEMLIIPFGGKPDSAQPLIAFALDDGHELWRAGKGQITYSSPVLVELHGKSQLLLVSEGQVAGYGVEDGETLWTIEWPGTANTNPAVSQPLVVGDSQLFVSKGYGHGAQLIDISFDGTKWTAEKVWHNARVLRTKFTNCVQRDGFVYGLSDGILECLELKSGDRKWKRGRYRHGQLLMVGEHLLISTEAGELALVKVSPDKYEELGKLEVIGDVTWNTLALSGNRLLIRNSTEAACVQLPLENEVAEDTELALVTEAD